MLSLKKINPSEKEMIFQNAYSEYIVNTSDYIKRCETIADIINTYLPVECYTNFRDALFHFFKMTRSTEENEIQHQLFAVREHAGRAKTDAEISLVDELRQLILWMLKNRCFDENIQIILKDLLNCLGNYELDLRIHGMMLEDGEYLSILDMKFFDIIEDVLQKISNVAADEFILAQDYRNSVEDA